MAITVTNDSINSATIANDGLNTGDVTFDTKGGTFGDPTSADTSGTTSDTFGSPGLSLAKDSTNIATVINDSI